MKKAILKAVKFLKSEDGYGTVELLILVAALGVLAVSVTGAINTKLTSNDPSSATSKLNSTITGLLDDASGDY